MKSTFSAERHALHCDVISSKRDLNSFRSFLRMVAKEKPKELVGELFEER
jgi:hypothetical protein